MKKALIIFTLLCSIQFGYSQIINVRVGGNASLGGTLTTVSSGSLTSDQDTSAFLATMIPMNIDIAPWKFVSFNVGYKIGSWLNEDPDEPNIVIKEKRTNTFLFGLKAYPLMKKNFHLYVGYDFGFGGFRTVKESTGLLVITEEQKWKGVNHNINLGMNWYFGGGLGMFFQGGYTGYNLDLKEFSWNNQDQLQTFDLSANMLVKGVQLELGFAYKFGEIE